MIRHPPSHSSRQNPLNSTLNDLSTLNSNLPNTRIITTTTLNPTSQQIITLLRLNLRASRTNSNVSDLIRALPALVDQPSNNGHDAVIPDDSLKQDLAIAKLGVCTASFSMEVTVSLPELWMGGGGSTVNERDVELRLDAAGLVKLAEEFGFVGGDGGECAFEGIEDIVLWKGYGHVFQWSLLLRDLRPFELLLEKKLVHDCWIALDFAKTPLPVSDYYDCFLDHGPQLHVGCLVCTRSRRT